jgi:hypothetical protein
MTRSIFTHPLSKPLAKAHMLIQPPKYNGKTSAPLVRNTQFHHAMRKNFVDHIKIFKKIHYKKIKKHTSNTVPSNYPRGIEHCGP